MIAERITVGPPHPGMRPRRPAKPRKPRETFWRTESVWTSEDEDILLADLLHLIPSDVKAHRVRISVERNPTNGYPHVIITFNHEIPNTKFADQTRDFEHRMHRYEQELSRWKIRDAEWRVRMTEYELDAASLHDRFARAFDEYDDILEKGAV